MSQPVKFRIDAGVLPPHRIEVDGEDVTSRVQGAQLHLSGNHHTPTLLTLFLKPGAGVIEGEGIVEVATDRPDAEVICEFLAGIDPAILQRDTLNGADASQSLTEVALDVLQHYARGEPWDPT